MKVRETEITEKKEKHLSKIGKLGTLRDLNHECTRAKLPIEILVEQIKPIYENPYFKARFKMEMIQFD